MGLSQPYVLTREDLRKYLEGYVLPLHNYSLAMCRAYTGIVSLMTFLADSGSGTLYYFSKRTLAGSHALQKILLGGVKSDGSYDVRSLRAFYRRVFGIDVPDFSLKDFLRNPNNEMLRTFLEISGIVAAACWLHLAAHQALELAGLTANDYGGYYSTAGDVIKAVEDDKLISDFADFASSVINFSSLVNPATSFIWSLRRNFKEYVEAAYPDVFKDSSAWGRLREVLGVSDNIGVLGGRVLVGYPEYTNPSSPYVAFDSCVGASVGGRLAIANAIALLLLKPGSEFLDLVKAFTSAAEGQAPSGGQGGPAELTQSPVEASLKERLAQSLTALLLRMPLPSTLPSYNIVDNLVNLASSLLKDPSHVLSPEEVQSIGLMTSFIVELLKDSAANLWQGLSFSSLTQLLNCLAKPVASSTSSSTGQGG